MESGAEHYQKREEAASVIRETVERIRNRFGIDIETTETPDTATICVKDTEGKTIREFGLMKTEHIPVADNSKKVSDVVEALLRFPDLDIVDAVQKVEVERKTGA